MLSPLLPPPPKKKVFFLNFHIVLVFSLWQTDDQNKKHIILHIKSIFSIKKPKYLLLQNFDLYWVFNLRYIRVVKYLDHPASLRHFLQIALDKQLTRIHVHMRCDVTIQRQQQRFLNFKCHHGCHFVTFREQCSLLYGLGNRPHCRIEL